MSYEDLPSIEEFTEDTSKLPSVDDFLTEEKEDLPSVEDYIEKEEFKEEVQTIEDLDGNTFAEIKDIVPPWPELVRLINDVRSDIPDIPEIKYYDKELEALAEQISQVKSDIPEIPEVKYYDGEIEAICEQIDSVKEKVLELPEVKYYDEQIKDLETRLNLTNQNIDELPEPEVHAEDLKKIRDEVERVKSEIPSFPKWVNEVNEVPDFSWIGKTFGVIDSDFIKVNDTIDTLRETVGQELERLIDDSETKFFENKVQRGTELNDLDEKYKEVKENIWKELRDSSLRIWEYHKEFKDDDRKLKKQINSQYNTLKKSLEENLKKVNENSIETDKVLLNYFEGLKEELSNIKIPEVKYYDDDIRRLKTDYKDLRELVRTIKSEQKELNEEVKTLNEVALEEPHDKPQSVGGQQDPLTPIDQQFATFKDLKQHYQIFINRIQTQIASIGGGGAGFIKDLDDVSFDQTDGDNKLLIYNQADSKWVGIASTAFSNDIVGIDTTGTSYFTNINAAGTIVGTAASFSGSISVAGTITYEDVTNIDSVGIVTARDGLLLGANGNATTIIALEAASSTTSSTSQSNIDTFSASVYRSAQYQVQVTRGSSYHVSTMNLVHDGTNVYMSEFGTIKTGAVLATFDADINSGNVRFRATPSSSSSTVFKISKVLTKV
jgi:hypothetical protein|tara:strand:- start:1556 stop:3547 length:1992 start_codon:yes stop_codon:yes gene_type:complete